MGLHIKHLEYYLPNKILTNNQLEKQFPEWNAEKIEGVFIFEL